MNNISDLGLQGAEVPDVQQPEDGGHFIHVLVSTAGGHQVSQVHSLALSCSNTYFYMEKHKLEEDQYGIINLPTHLWYDGGWVREVAGRQPGGDEGADGQQGDQVVRVPRDLR